MGIPNNKLGTPISKLYFVFYLKATWHYFICCKTLFSISVLQKCCKNRVTILVKPANPHKYWIFQHFKTKGIYSHSIVAGGLGVISYITLFTPSTSATILHAILFKSGYGNSATSALIASLDKIALIAIACS